MAPRWTESAGKHDVSRQDQIAVMLRPNYVAEFVDEAPADGRIVLFIGNPHQQTDREVEILVHEFPGTGREAVIFHAMQLGPKFRRYREEHPDG